MFAYCGNSPISNCDHGGCYYVSTESRITIDGICSRGSGIALPYITDQAALGVGEKRLGLGNVADNGCGVVASYNALNELSGKSDFDTVRRWYNDSFGTRLCFGGLGGVYVDDVVEFFEKRYYQVKVTDDLDVMDELATTADASILYYQWDSGRIIPPYYGHYVYFHRQGTSYCFYNINGGIDHFKQPSQCASSVGSTYSVGIFIYK